MFRSIFRKPVALALTAIAALALAAGAYAYFSGSGNGTGSASVGSTAGFKVTVGSDITGSLLPGSGSETLSYTVQNNSTGVQNLAATGVAVASKNGDITQNGTEVVGCQAGWFTATNSTPAPTGEIQGGQSVNGSVTVTMQDANTSQDLCQRATPDITVSAS